MFKPLIAYYRVSTREQGRSGLGLDAQRAAVARFAEAEGFEVVSEFTEIETGKGADDLDYRMPQLAASLAAARRNGKAPVVVAKLDRLSRDGHFISGLMAQKTPFLVAVLGPRTSSRSCRGCGEMSLRSACAEHRGLSGVGRREAGHCRATLAR